MQPSNRVILTVVASLALLTAACASSADETGSAPSQQAVDRSCSNDVLADAVKAKAYLESTAGAAEENALFFTAESYARTTPQEHSSDQEEAFRTALKGYAHRITTGQLNPASKSATRGVYEDCGEPIPS